ncbi:MAG TPA: dTMP kinase [Patescibacteria group bacterium]|nr:dTMP kinase [Patescibacteria group bacterium]
MFVTFEGSEGSGKSTQIDLLADFLRAQDLVVVTTREPGGTSIGEQVRDCLHAVKNTLMTAAAEVLLYSASRSQLVNEVIIPALAKGQIVLSDRYADSTLAYQGYGRQLDLETLLRITDFATGGLTPDMTFFLDVDIKAGLTRRTVGQAEINRMDLQDIEFYKRVRMGYLTLAAQAPDRWIIIDANRAVDELQADIRSFTTQRLAQSQITAR